MIIKRKLSFVTVLTVEHGAVSWKMFIKMQVRILSSRTSVPHWLLHLFFCYLLTLTTRWKFVLINEVKFCRYALWLISTSSLLFRSKLSSFPSTPNRRKGGVSFSSHTKKKPASRSAWRRNTTTSRVAGYVHTSTHSSQGDLWYCWGTSRLKN